MRLKAELEKTKEEAKFQRCSSDHENSTVCTQSKCSLEQDDHKTNEDLHSFKITLTNMSSNKTRMMTKEKTKFSNNENDPESS